MSVRYEFLFSVYSAPPFITEILMVLLVIVILGFPCTSYMSRYVCKNPVLPSEAPPEVGVTETLPGSNEPVIDQPGTFIGALLYSILLLALRCASWTSRTSSTGNPEPGQDTEPDIHPEPGEDIEPVVTFPDDSYIHTESGIHIRPDIHPESGLHFESYIDPEPGQDIESDIHPEDGQDIEPVVTLPDDSYIHTEPGLHIRPDIHPEPGPHIESDTDPEPGLHTEPDVYILSFHDDSTTDDSSTDDSGPDDSGPDDSGPDDSGPDDSGPDDSGTGNTGPNDPGPAESGPEEHGREEHGREEPGREEPGREEPGREEPGPEMHGPVDAAGYTSSQDDFQVSRDVEVVVEVHADRDRQNNQGSTQRSVQVLYSKIENYPIFSHSETEEYNEKCTLLPNRKYFTTDKSVREKMFPEADKHSVFRNIPGDCITPRNEIRRGEMGSLYKQQTGNISTGSATKKDFKWQSLIAEESCFLPDTLRLKPYEILSHKEETSSQDNSFTSVSSSPLFSNNSKLANSLKMRFKRIQQRSNRRNAERNEPRKSKKFIPHTEHSVTDNLGKRYFVKCHSHISKIHNWCRAKDVDDLNYLPSMNENTFLKQLPFTSSEGEDIDKEKHNYYNKAMKRRCSFESKESHDNYKRRYEAADLVKSNAYGSNTCYCSAEDKLGYFMKDRRHPLTEEDPKNYKDPFYFESYSQSERFQHSMNTGGIGKFKSSSDVNDVESTLSDKHHNRRLEEAKLFVEFLKEVHYKNLRRKSESKLQRKGNYYPQLSSDESAIHYPPGESNELNVGDNNGKSVSETMKVSELKYFQTSTTNSKYFYSTDEKFDVHDM